MNKSPEQPRKALGRGLSALLPSRSAAAPRPEATSAPAEAFPLDANVLPITSIRPNPNQPRSDFDPEKLNELAQSIRANGIIQPITVQAAENGTYLLIAGERRWRAAQLAGLTEIPVHVKHVETERISELALIENIQRVDLNPVDTAKAFRELVDFYHLSHDQIAERTGKDRSTITNFLRLLRLTEPVLQALASGHISVGHARALLNVTDAALQRNTCDRIHHNALSVRETEALVKRLTTPPAAPSEKPPALPLDPNIRAALDEMAMALGTKVRLIAKSENSGRLEIEYYSQDDLDRIYAVVTSQLQR
jgi:ParB family transcriptional regulator, chromosome partitioning protein